MNKFWLLLILSATAGTATAWMFNDWKYGRDAVFGPITLDGSVKAENVMVEIAKNYTDKRPIAAMLGSDQYDFGVMAPDEKGEHSFVIKNAGQAPLSLKLGGTSCKCTFVDDFGPGVEKMLDPGKEMKITLSWEVKTDANVFAQSAQVITNDPTNVVLNLSVSGKVVRQIEVVPEAWTFGEAAAGEPFEISGKVYSYVEHGIIPAISKMSFANETMTELTEFVVEPFTPGEADAPHAKAKQAFNVTAKVKPGMRQGAITTRFLFAFQKQDENGEIIRATDEDDDDEFYVRVETAGRIVGSLSMIVGSKLREASGSYIYDFGRLADDDSLKAKTFIVLKGAEREKTKLSVGEIFPDEVIQAKMGDPVSRGTMVLYPLSLEIIPGDKPLDYLGKNKTDFGWLWIESDNPKVARMRLAVKFAVDPRP